MKSVHTHQTHGNVKVCTENVLYFVFSFGFVTFLDFFGFLWIFGFFWVIFGFFNSNCYDLGSMYTIASCIVSERFSYADQIVDKNFYASVVEKCIFESNQIFEF